MPTPITASEFDGVSLLTEAELHVFKHIGRGLTTAEIADIKGAKKSQSTVEAQLYTMRKKLRLADTAKLRVYAARFLAFQDKFEVTIVREKAHQKLILNHD